MPAIAVMVTWKNVGFYVVIYLAGLQYIPRSCQEAIELDGATAWQRFRHLTLPLLLPQTILVVTLSTINGFQLFIEPYVMTGGGPLRRTFSVVLYMYTNAFSYQKMGYAATIGVALALIIGAVVADPAPRHRQGGGAVKTLARIALYAGLGARGAHLHLSIPLDGIEHLQAATRGRHAGAHAGQDHARELPHHVEPRAVRPGAAEQHARRQHDHRRSPRARLDDCVRDGAADVPRTARH